MGTSIYDINLQSLSFQLTVLVLDSTFIGSLFTVKDSKMFLYIGSYFDWGLSLWSVYIIQGTDVVRVMEVSYKLIHVVPKLFEGLFVWFEIHIAIHLVGGST